jgi:hypothetical protein
VPKPQGTAADVGLSKPTTTEIEKRLLDAAVAKDTANALLAKVLESPASQGVVGLLRGTAQNLVQAGGEVGAYFGGQVKAVTDQIQQGAADADVGAYFDPNIPAIDMLSNLLAFQYAKMTTGERLSNEMMQQSRRALGLDRLDANQANSVARIREAVKAIGRQEQIMLRAHRGGVNGILEQGGAPEAAPAPTPHAMPSAGTPEFQRIDGKIVRVR